MTTYHHGQQTYDVDLMELTVATEQTIFAGKFEMKCSGFSSAPWSYLCWHISQLSYGRINACRCIPECAMQWHGKIGVGIRQQAPALMVPILACGQTQHLYIWNDKILLCSKPIPQHMVQAVIYKQILQKCRLKPNKTAQIFFTSYPQFLHQIMTNIQEGLII